MAKNKTNEIRFKLECDWFESSVDMINTEISSSIFAARLRKLESHFENLTLAYENILEVEIDEKIIKDYDVRYKNAVFQYDQLGAKSMELPGLQAAPVPPAPVSRLPQINLPEFNGDIFAWAGFMSLYTSLVKSRTDISKTEKFHYLVSHLHGEPKSLIQHLPMTDASLNIALEILALRYDNIRLLADSHISRILNLTPIKKQTALRTQILNPLLESTRALKCLGFPTDQWSYILLYIGLTKLPIDMKTRFEQRYGGLKKNLPTFDNLMEFLQNECHLIDTANASEMILNKIGKSVNVIEQRTSNSDNSFTNVRCAFCSISGHGVVDCYKFKNGSSNERKMWVRNNNRCFRCFGTHSAAMCDQFIPCVQCGNVGHNYLICTLEMNKRDLGDQYNRPTRTERAMNAAVLTPSNDSACYRDYAHGDAPSSTKNTE